MERPNSRSNGKGLNNKSLDECSERLIDLYINGISAEARILSIEEAHSCRSRNFCRMMLAVKPEHSREFKTTGYAPVSSSLVPKAGDRIVIKYDPSDNTKFVVI